MADYQCRTWEEYFTLKASHAAYCKDSRLWTNPAMPCLVPPPQTRADKFREKAVDAFIWCAIVGSAGFLLIAAIVALLVLFSADFSSVSSTDVLLIVVVSALVGGWGCSKRS